MNELILKDIQPLNTQILTTANKYPAENKLEKAGLLLDLKKAAGNYKLYQTVIATGPMVRQLKVGDVIQIDPTRYFKLEHPEDRNSIRETVKIRNTYTKIELPILEVNGEERCLIDEKDAAFIIKSYEEK